jgi:magnesium transporter
VTSSPLTGSYTGYFRNAAGVVNPLPQDDAAIRAALAQPGGLVWIDLTIAVPEDTRILSEIFDFHALSIEDVVSPIVDPAKIDDHGSYIFIVVQALTGYEVDAELETVEVEFYLGPNYVISCHRQAPPSISVFCEKAQLIEHIMHRSAAWVLHGLLDGIVDDYLPIVDELDETIDRLENEVLVRPDQSLLHKILKAKRNSLRLRRATSPQRDIMNRLSRGEFPALIPAETSMYFRDIYDHLVRIEYLIEALRDLSDGALQTYLSVVSNRLNEVMRVLTAVATIILPLTLIAGLFGTNYSANVWPGYDTTWGFPAVATSMVVAAVGMLIYFRWRRWL